MNNKYMKETIYGKVKVVERQDGQYAVIDLEGNEIVPFGKYAWIDGFDHGLARVRIGHSQNTTHVFGPDGKEVPLWRKWGIINKQGIEVLPVIYDNIWNFLGKNRLSVRVESKELGNKDVYFTTLTHRFLILLIIKNKKGKNLIISMIAMVVLMVNLKAHTHKILWDIVTM